MKYLKVIIFILVILLLYVSIRFYVETRPLRMLKKLEEYSNEMTKERHSRNEYFMFEMNI